MTDDAVYTGSIRHPTILYCAIEDEARMRQLCPEMEVIADWRVRPGCWYAVTKHRTIPPMPVDFLAKEVK